MSDGSSTFVGQNVATARGALVTFQDVIGSLSGGKQSWQESEIST